MTTLQYSCLENSIDGGTWWATVYGVEKSWTQLSNFTFTFAFALNVNRLNTPTKRHGLAEQMKTYAYMHFHLPHHSA